MEKPKLTSTVKNKKNNVNKTSTEKNCHRPSSNYNHDRQWPVLVARTSQFHCNGYDHGQTTNRIVGESEGVECCAVTDSLLVRSHGSILNAVSVVYRPSTDQDCRHCAHYDCFCCLFLSTQLFILQKIGEYINKQTNSYAAQ